MTSHVDQPISLDSVVSFLVSTPLFDGLDPAERAEVVRIMEVQRLTDGEEVFHEGDLGDSWYVIYDGNARVLKQQADGGAWQIRSMGPGACFGEIAILDGQARSATVIAGGPLTLFRFRRARFEQLLEQGSLGAYKLVLGMARMLSERHRQLTQELSQFASREALASTSSDRQPSSRGVAGTTIAEYQSSE